MDSQCHSKRGAWYTKMVCHRFVREFRFMPTILYIASNKIYSNPLAASGRILGQSSCLQNYTHVGYSDTLIVLLSSQCLSKQGLARERTIDRYIQIGLSCCLKFILQKKQPLMLKSYKAFEVYRYCQENILYRAGRTGPADPATAGSVFSVYLIIIIIHLY